MGTTKEKSKFGKNFFENSAWDDNALVCGIDEVGRGCLAGPVVAAAVVLPHKKAPQFLKDSKVLSEQERNTTAKWIEKNCYYAIGIIHHRLIDQHNIWHATLFAMKKAVFGLLISHGKSIKSIVIDAMPLSLENSPYHDIPVHYFIKGEEKSSSIAAASIIAKVKRDQLMQKFSGIFPGYFLEKHKGYATPQHKKSILEEGHSLIHRVTFLSQGTITNGSITKDQYEEQQSLC